MNKVILPFIISLVACQNEKRSEHKAEVLVPGTPYLVVLGVAQDAGYPQAGCYKEHCMRAWHDPSLKRSATCLALIDPQSKKKWLFEATPDIKEQLFMLEQYAPDSVYELAGVFLTHGHIGHYTGLMHFGREAMNTKHLNAYAMPGMYDYLSENGPWDQLVKLRNIVLQPMTDSAEVELTSAIKVMPFEVPHRDEYTETVGYRVSANETKMIFIPDIDKWSKWSRSITRIIKENDYAFLDATFFDQAELPGRDMSEIPHPFVAESMDRFSELGKVDKSKIHFIHFNHSNPLLNIGSDAYKIVEQEFKVSDEGMIIRL
ncbi:MAG: MBL fold metallo-hydrolase [Bacteroidota bacterium]